MRAVQFSEYGGPEVMHVAEAEEPHAGTGQIRVAVEGAGVNPVDWKIRSGMMQQFMPVPLPITGSPDNIVTIADVRAAEHGVPVSSGAERSYQALGQAAKLAAGRSSRARREDLPLRPGPGGPPDQRGGHVRGKPVLTPD